MSVGPALVRVDWAGRPVDVEVRRIAQPGAGDATLAPIVFLHEGLGSVSMWRDFPDALCAAVGRAGIVFSRPGYGRSTPREPDERWHPDTVDEWFLCGPMALVQLCRDTLADLGVDRAHVRYELFTTDRDRSDSSLDDSRAPRDACASGRMTAPKSSELTLPP